MSMLFFIFQAMKPDAEWMHKNIKRQRIHHPTAEQTHGYRVSAEISFSEPKYIIGTVPYDTAVRDGRIGAKVGGVLFMLC